MSKKQITNLGFDKQYLNLQHMYQLSESDIPEEERINACSPTCITMVLNYLLGDDNFKENSADILNKMADIDTKSDIGWKHSTVVNLFKSYGLTSWRRNWNVVNDINYFKQEEGYDDWQIGAVNNQISKEDSLKAIQSLQITQYKALYSIYESIANGYPVIVSVKKGFSSNGAAHQVVVFGFDYKKEDIILNIADPIVASNRNNECSLDRFFEYFNYLAIFVKD
jgi:hypothetical protein